MPQDLQPSSQYAGPGRPRRRRGRGGAPKRGGGAPPYGGGSAPGGDAGGYGGEGGGAASSAGYGSGGNAAGGYGGGGQGGGGFDGGGSGGEGGGDWGGGRGGRRRRGRRGGRGHAPRRGGRPPGAAPGEFGGEAPPSEGFGGGFGEGIGYDAGAPERGDGAPQDSGGDYPRQSGAPQDGGGFGGYGGGGYGGGGYGGAEGVAPRERRGGPGRQGGAFAKPQAKRGRRGQKPRGKFRGEGGGPGQGHAGPAHGGPAHGGPAHGGPSHYQGELVEITGVLELEKGGTGHLRQASRNFHRLPEDTFVAQQTIHRYGLRDGSFIEGRQSPSPGPGKKPILREVLLVDGMDPQEAKHLPHFKRLVSVDPDFQYRLGEVPIETGMEQGDTALRIMDMLMPLGRGQRALIVAPPRGGKTVLMQKMAKAIELKYPDVHLMVMLIDERPEEGTHWKRSVKGEVYVSTADESAKDHIQTAEGVWRRACRLCECGQEVVLLLDSITRLARAYNQEIGNSGRILSGGIDSRTMERPKKIFGSARNTEDGGSLTIIGTCLVDTGSKMDQVIFEEFKGTGNMEINLSRMLAEKRIFPAFDLAGSGTRKEERLLERSELMKVSLLRRVLNKMRPMEAMELLVKKLEQYPTNRDFLEQFNLVNYQ